MYVLRQPDGTKWGSTPQRYLAERLARQLKLRLYRLLFGEEMEIELHQ